MNWNTFKIGWCAAIIFVCIVAEVWRAHADELPKTYILSSALVEEIFQQLAKEPYISVAPLITKLQTEVAHQPPSKPPISSLLPAPAPAPDSKPIDEEKKK
jgi:hypothetical protein